MTGCGYAFGASVMSVTILLLETSPPEHAGTINGFRAAMEMLGEGINKQRNATRF